MSNELPGKVVVELGSGTGVVGIVAGLLGAREVVLTDLPYALDNARENVRLNAGTVKGAIHCKELDWCAVSMIVCVCMRRVRSAATGGGYVCLPGVYVPIL